jgi:hypothetical protein
MKKKLGPKKILAIRCPTCGAAPGEKCELSTGQPRAEPHRDRRLIAADLSQGLGGPLWRTHEQEHSDVEDNCKTSSEWWVGWAGSPA